MPAGKREFLARLSARTGFTSVLARMPKRRVLMILNYHRIGNSGDTLYDPGVFSATAEEFDEQVGFLKRRFHMAGLDEAVAMANGESPLRTSVLITFDDGYLDNYTSAFPVLRSHGVPGLFFLPTAFVGTCHLPFWDVIAYIVRQSRKKVICLEYPEPARFDLETEGVPNSLMKILRLYKSPATTQPDRFLEDLQNACQSPAPPPESERRFLNWEEAREMHRAGMAFGSHTHNHEILSKLPPARQCEELRQSRQILEREFRCPIDVLSYPDGGRNAFSAETIDALRQNGYRAAFSYYGGMNRPGELRPFDLRRCGVERPSHARFRLQTSLAAIAGKGWF
ncbi:MAG TPA: polysaccharide deacetylase family protein [Bryobacteraceae bacterium]|nr:polysaccharide deacetylase family protein [Bryobacteraceae bacterium]